MVDASAITFVSDFQAVCCKMRMKMTQETALGRRSISTEVKELSMVIEGKKNKGKERWR